MDPHKRQLKGKHLTPHNVKWKPIGLHNLSVQENHCCIFQVKNTSCPLPEWVYRNWRTSPHKMKMMYKWSSSHQTGIFIGDSLWYTNSLLHLPTYLIISFKLSVHNLTSKCYVSNIITGNLKPCHTCIANNNISNDCLTFHITQHKDH